MSAAANSLIERLPDSRGGEYVTPETVADAMRRHDHDKVRLELLWILSNTAGVGAEDAGLCCFVAFYGPDDD